MSGPLSDVSPLELFRREVEERVLELTQALLQLERKADDQASLERFLRGLHSIKGAAAIVGLQPLVQITHDLEDAFSRTCSGDGRLPETLVAKAFDCIDRLEALCRLPADAIPGWLEHPEATDAGTKDPSERMVKVEVENLNRIMGLSGELLVEARWLQPFADALALLRQRHKELHKTLEALQLHLHHTGGGPALPLVENAQQRQRDCHDLLSDRLADLERYALRTTNLSDRLYREVIGSNMRPLADALVSLPRMVRDLAKTLGKQVQLDVVGRATPVDRDILRRLEAPLIHVLRNAIDHGIEPPREREASGKAPWGTIRIEAMHRGGLLAISISDDGAGVPLQAVRQRLIEEGHCSPAEAEQLSSPALLNWLEHPGFSTARTVTEVSGRGIGLDVVRSMVTEVGGSLRLQSTPGHGTALHFQLPLTLSVVRTLLVEIAGEPYAFPLARLDRIVSVEPSAIELVEGRACVHLDDQAVGLIEAHRLLGLEASGVRAGSVTVVVVSEQDRIQGLVVDRHLGEQDLVVRPLDPRLGRVHGISAAALMGNGHPVLIIDTAEVVRGAEALLRDGEALGLRSIGAAQTLSPMRVLISDDSAAALDLQARLIAGRGYRVDRARDGGEALQALRSITYDLLITDVEMPVMDGITLIRRLRGDPRHARLPIIITSSRAADEDRRLGLEAGADLYLVKSDFKDATLLQAVEDLIGPAPTLGGQA